MNTINNVFDQMDNIIDNIEKTETSVEQPVQQPQQPQMQTEHLNSDQNIYEAFQVIEEELNIEETSVELVGLKDEVIITPIQKEDELMLETNRLSMYTFSKRLNTIIYSHMKLGTLKDHNKLKFKDLDSFEKNLIAVDRALLVYGLLMISFDKLASFPLVCESCEKEFIADFETKNLSMEFDKNHIEELMNTDLMTYKKTLSFLNDKLEIDIGFNPEYIRLELLRNLSREEVSENIDESNGNLLLSLLDNMILYMKEIRVYKADKRTSTGKKLILQLDSTSVENFIKLRDFIINMPLKSREILLDQFTLEDLDKFLPSFETKIVCPFCNHIHTLPFNPETEFFRKALYYSPRGGN